MPSYSDFSTEEGSGLQSLLLKL